jgi:hypothetical protein
MILLIEKLMILEINFVIEPNEEYLEATIGYK